MKGVVVAGTHSGVGKTVATLAFIRALKAAGYEVQPAKAGPDFIDPSHHAAVAGRPSRSLDCWLCGEEGVRRNYYRGEGDICVIEGMMGLYDGERCSTAMVAEALSLPVVLVVDASASMESVAATALGFREYAAVAGHDVEVAGVVAQRAHGGRHEDGIREALPNEIAYLGRIPPSTSLEIPDRHLGLHMGDEAALPADALADAAATLDVDTLLSIASEAASPDSTVQDRGPESGDSIDVQIAVAHDAAFCFTYPATLERLRAGSDLLTFSPVAGDPIPDCDGVYLPGGYPELHADALSASDTLADLADRASDGLPVVGECGGFMAMAESLTTADGVTHEMAAIVPAAIEMHDRYQALDHVELEARRDAPTARSGTTYCGHEFHYSSANVGTDARFAFEVTRGTGIDGTHDGLLAYNSIGSYTHLHAESGAFDRFLESV